MRRRGGAGSVLPGGSIGVGGEGGAEDGVNGGAFRLGKVRERGVVGAGIQGALQGEEETLPQGAGQVFDEGTVDEVAAPVLEETGLEVEILEGSTIGRGAAVAPEVGLEGGVGEETSGGQRGFVGEKEVAGEVEGVAIEFGEDFGGERPGAVVEEGAGVIGGMHDPVDEADLVFVKEVGGEITGGAGGVAAGVEPRARFDRRGEESVSVQASGLVAPVRGERAASGEVPAPETQVQGDGMAVPGGVGPEGLEGAAVGAGHDGFGEQPGDVTGGGTGMTIHAAIRTFHAEGLVRTRDVEDVEDRAEFRIEGNDLESAPRDVPDVGVVAEVEGAGVGGGDEADLKAGGGEEEEL